MRHSPLITVLLCLVCMPALAQEDPVAIEIQTKDIAPTEPYPEGFRSLFYTPKEHKTLLEALRRRIPPERRRLMRDGTGDDIDLSFIEGQAAAIRADSSMDYEEESAVPPPRVVYLSGLVYTSAKDWTLWLNGQRLAAGGELPDTVTHLNVGKDHVELKWYDKLSGEVLPLRLRPHQGFNIDTRTFVSGAAAKMQTPSADPADAAPSADDDALVDDDFDFIEIIGDDDDL